MTFRGNQVSEEEVRPDESKIWVVMDWPESKTVKNPQGFLGFDNFLNRYIENCATLAAHLYERTRGLRGKTKIELSQMSSKRSRG